MGKTKTTLRSPKNGSERDFTVKAVNKVNVRFNNECALELLVNMTELTVSGLINGTDKTYTVEGTITEVE